MVTKTLTITREAYNLLARDKRKDESFSEAIKRAYTKKRRKLNDFFGIISENEGKMMLNDLAKIQTENIRALRGRA